MDNNYFLNMNNVRSDGFENKIQFKQAKTDRRNKDSKLSLTVRNPKNINNKRIHQLKKILQDLLLMGLRQLNQL